VLKYIKSDINIYFVENLKTFEGFNFFGKKIVSYQDIDAMRNGRDSVIVLKEYDDYYQTTDHTDSGSYKGMKYPKSEYSKEKILQEIQIETGRDSDREEWDKWNKISSTEIARTRT